MAPVFVPEAFPLVLDDNTTFHDGCLPPPLCHSPSKTLWGRVVCAVRRDPLKAGSAAYRLYVSRRLDLLAPRMVAGQFVLPSILRAVRHKLAHPSQPLVLHLAGDNGVGKTRTAEMISLAMAQRCGNVECTLGDTTLTLSGTSYDGLPLPDFRLFVVKAVAQHAKVHGSRSVVIINELSSLDREKVKALLPLLGRGEHFPEFPSVDLSELTVVVTTDFGMEGRTRGMSLQDMRNAINRDFQDLYSRSSTGILRTQPFLPISLDTAQTIAQLTVSRLACDYQVPLHLGADAKDFLLETVKAELPARNGRAVSQAVVEVVEPLLATWSDGRDKVGEGGLIVSITEDGEFILTSG